jgi:hypothetical protein
MRKKNDEKARDELFYEKSLLQRNNFMHDILTSLMYFHCALLWTKLVCAAHQPALSTVKTNS